MDSLSLYLKQISNAYIYQKQNALIPLHFLYPYAEKIENTNTRIALLTYFLYLIDKEITSPEYPAEQELHQQLIKTYLSISICDDFHKTPIFIFTFILVSIINAYDLAEDETKNFYSLFFRLYDFVLSREEQEDPQKVEQLLKYKLTLLQHFNKLQLLIICDQTFSTLPLEKVPTFSYSFIGRPLCMYHLCSLNLRQAFIHYYQFNKMTIIDLLTAQEFYKDNREMLGFLDALYLQHQ